MVSLNLYAENTPLLGLLPNSDCIAKKEKLEKVILNKDAQNYYEACFLLANYYYEGRKGIPKDKTKAKEYYSKALKASLPKANDGNAKYQYIVAICTRREKYNSKQAYEWLEKSATQGYAPAQAKLAFWYMKGIGVDKPDIEKAAQWAKKASSQGNMLGKALLGAYYMNVKKDVPRGIKLIQESANAGNAGGQYMLYRCMYYGKGVKKDRTKAPSMANIIQIAQKCYRKNRTRHHAVEAGESDVSANWAFSPQSLATITGLIINSNTELIGYFNKTHWAQWEAVYFNFLADYIISNPDGTTTTISFDTPTTLQAEYNLLFIAQEKFNSELELLPRRQTLGFIWNISTLNAKINDSKSSVTSWVN